MPLHRRVPKRGFHNPFRIEYDVVNLDDLTARFDAGTVVTPELLREQAAEWAPRFTHLPRPYVAVLLGGHNAAVSPLRRLSSYRLGTGKIIEIGERWRPYRTLASLFLWRSLYETPV